MKKPDKFVVQKVGRGHPRSGSWMVSARYDGEVKMTVPIVRLLGSQEAVAQDLVDKLNDAWHAWKQDKEEAA
jgi:hypothetical protein